MNRLKGMTAYLCGAMDRVKDGGVKWRQYMTPKLQELGVGVLDPCDKPVEIALEDEAKAFPAQCREFIIVEIGNVAAIDLI